MAFKPSELVRRRLARYVPVPEAGCWIFTGAWTHPNHGGYGVYSISDREKLYAHRFFYEQLVGPIPAGMCVCHKCDTPSCVNPDHLFLGTQSENMADRQKKGRYRGEWNGRAILTETQVVQMRREWAALTSRRQRAIFQRDQAARFGVSCRTIYSAVKNISWRYSA